MDLHKYTGIRSVKGECGAGSCPFKVTRWPDAQSPLAFQNNTRASGTDIFGLWAGKASRFCCAGGEGWTQHGSSSPARESRAGATRCHPGLPAR